MGSDVNGDIFGPDYKGYIFRITGGNDKQGFTMKQGILVNGRVRILMKQSKSHAQPPPFSINLHSQNYNYYLIEMSIIYQIFN